MVSVRSMFAEPGKKQAGVNGVELPSGHLRPLFEIVSWPFRRIARRVKLQALTASTKKLGMADAEVTRGDMGALLLDKNSKHRGQAGERQTEPRTKMSTKVHIEEGRKSRSCGCNRPRRQTRYPACIHSKKRLKKDGAVARFAGSRNVQRVLRCLR